MSDHQLFTLLVSLSDILIIQPYYYLNATVNANWNFVDKHFFNQVPTPFSAFFYDCDDSRLGRLLSVVYNTDPICSLNDMTLNLIIISLSLIISTFLIYMIYTLICLYDGPIGNYFESICLNISSKLFKQLNVRPCSLRAIFMRTPATVTKSKLVGHTHGESAKSRNNSAVSIDLFAMMFGKIAYFVQRSVSDERHHRQGCRSYHWGKDLNATREPFNPPPDCILSLVDVDMYLDMPHMLAHYPAPYMISTFQPTSVAQSTGEYTFTFDESDNVNYIVSGGAKYTHPVWNYHQDVFTASTSWLYLFKKNTVYNVDRKKLDDHHQLLLLTPISTYLSFSTPTDSLNRLKVAVKTSTETFLRLSIVKEEGLFMSTGKAMTYNCATIPITQDNALAGLVSVNDVKLASSQVKQLLETNDTALSTILVEYHRSLAKHTVDYVFPIKESVVNYQYVNKYFDDQPKESLIPFMSPVILNCFSPVKSRANDEACVVGRVEDIRSHVDITPLDVTLMSEFVDLLIPIEHRHKYHPVDNSVVFDKQNRPTQRNALNAASLFAKTVDYNGMVQCFQKSESYDDIKDPRNISTIPKISKLNYSRYMYAITAYVQKFPWYAFGKTPKETAERVAEICKYAEEILLTDFSRMDGRVSNYLRDLEQMLCLAFFHVGTHAELLELLASQVNQRAVTKFGRKFDTGTSRLSGSPDTAVMNTICNAFIGYKAKRTLKVNGDYLSPEAAFKVLGLYGGDDGLTADVPAEHYAATALTTGQVLDAVTIKRGDNDVSFLARLYSPLVWFGDVNSMCDVRRQLSKLHVTSVLPSNITPIQKLAEKLASFILTDSNTPVLGDLCQVFVSKYSSFVPAVLGKGIMRGVGYYHALADKGDQYPNENIDNWMDASFLRLNPSFDRLKFARWLDLISTTIDVNLVLRPPLCESSVTLPIVKVPVVANGELLTPPKFVFTRDNLAANKVTSPVTFVPSKISSPTVVEGEKATYVKGKYPCKLFLLGKCTWGANCKHSH